MSTSPTLLVLGAGPGLGMSVARRFGAEGYAVGLVSRSADRHPGYLDELHSAGVRAVAVAADVREPGRLRRAVDEVESRLGPVDVVYHGPGADNPAAAPVGILETGAADVREVAAQVVEPAIELAGLVLPGMRERGSGAIVYVAGLSAVVPLPFLGPFAPASAALRTYALTLAEAVASDGVHVGSLVIGGLVERGDIHRMLTSLPADAGDAHGAAVAGATLDPDDLADAVWRIAAGAEREVVADAITT
ncbi:Short-chain dehydrogenase [Promicromonospora umidemergens]|uniref:SDR family NAD(P)-dependent oxidoreductase n=1 Tax=Promicromonospora umidemergens TaxID=629679 RepID=A0ABP8XAM6_9MICO|nr:SDR family NAD(P)-dependent oxidoreductase [Promicromonospora umidemergens]MCP2281668.1 Short-chain dehydrogenase [Promicromonospora umidemergens]